MEEKLLVIKVNKEQYEKLSLVANHICSSPDQVAASILKASIDSVSWQLEDLKKVLEDNSCST